MLRFIGRLCCFETKGIEDLGPLEASMLLDTIEINLNNGLYIYQYMKKVILFLLLAATALMAEAQMQITGVLKNAKEKQPVMFANVALMRASDSTFLRGTTSDEKGAFKLENDTIPTYLRISAIGYETHFARVPNTRYGGPTGLATIDMGTILLNEGAMTLDAVVVTEKRPIYSVDGEKDLYNVAEDASIQTGNASDALQNAPGVEVDVEGNVTLNGSSVTVWINDRPSHLEGEALKQYIKMLPANSIDRIEVMKNPSAKYGGGGPVVNIITNQRMLRNSFVSFGANGNSRPSIAPWTSYVYSNEKFHLSAYLSYNGSRSVSDGTSSGQMFDADSVLSRDWQEVNDATSRQHNVWANLNASYEIDSMNRINGYFGTYPSTSKSSRNNEQTRMEYLSNPGDYSFSSHFDDRNSNFGGFGGASYTHKFNNDGHEISLDYTFNFYGYDNSHTNYRHYLYQPQMSYDQHSITNMFRGSNSFSANYSLPYSKKGELEMGLEYGFSNNRNYYYRDTLNRLDNQYYCDYLLSDTVHEPGHNARTYLTWRRKFGKFTLKLGSSLDYDFSSNRHEEAPQYDVVARSLSFSPSVHLSYRTKSMHNFSGSYRMRTTHPSAGKLSTYPRYGVESFSIGNPLLEPYYEHNADLSWNKYFSKFGSVGANASFKSNINEFNSIDDARYVDYFDRVVDYSTWANNADGWKWSLNANCMYRPTAFFNVRLSGGISDDWYRVVVREGQPPVEDEMLSWNVRCKVWAKLWKKMEVFATCYYNSPSHGWSKLAINHERKGFDLGMSADFWDRRLSLYFNAHDLFNWNRWGTTVINPYYSSTSDDKYNSRYISFGATLRFGKMELESRARTGATEASIGG